MTVTYTFKTINNPYFNDGTNANGINASGQIVAAYSYWSYSLGGYIGASFLYDGSSFTPLSDPLGQYGTWTYGINASGQVVGSYQDSATRIHGFLYSNGSYSTLNDPSGVNGTYAYGINSAGKIVGSYEDSAYKSHGFLYSGGTYTTIDDPLGVNGTSASGINASNQIVGSYTDAGYKSHGFIYAGGTYTTIDDPLGIDGTISYGINASGQVVGGYFDSTDHLHGFLYSGGTYTTIDNPLGANSTVLSGINDAGQIVGSYNAANNVTYGFVATPPATWIGGQNGQIGVGDWATASNWSPAVVPGSTNDVLVGGTGDYLSVYIYAPAQAHNLTEDFGGSGKTVQVELDSSLSLSGSLILNSGAAFFIQTTGAVLTATGGITISSNSGGLYSGWFNPPAPFNATINADIANNGVLSVARTLTINGLVSGSGTTVLANGASLELNGTASDQVSINDGSILKLDDAADTTSKISAYGHAAIDLAGAKSFGGQLALVGVSSTLDLIGISTASYTYVGQTLKLIQTNGQELDLSTSFAPSIPDTVTYIPQVTSDSHGGTLIDFVPVTTSTWIGGQNFNDWATTSNWTPASVPTATSHVVIDSGFAGIKTAETAHDVVVGAGGSLTVSSTLSLGNSLTVDGIVVIGSNFSYSGEVDAPGGIAVDAGGRLWGEGYSNTIGGDVVNNSQGGSGGQLWNGGVAALEGTTFITGLLTGSGFARIWDGATLELGGASDQTVKFSSSIIYATYGSSAVYDGASLQLDDPGHFAGTITGVAAGDNFTGLSNVSVPVPDKIWLKGISIASLDYVGTTLTVHETGGGTLAYTVTDSAGQAVGDSTAMWDDTYDATIGPYIYWQLGQAHSWIDGVNGDWAAGANWISGTSPTGYDTAIIGGTQAYTVTVGAADNVAANVLDWTDPNSTLIVKGTLTLNKPDGVANLIGGTLQIDGGHLLLMQGSGGAGLVLDNATVAISNGGILEAHLQSDFSDGGPMVNLTLGSNFTLVQSAAASNYITLGAGNDSYGLATITNNGTIHAEVAGGVMTTTIGSNAGSIYVANGETFSAASFDTDRFGSSTTSFSNSGNVIVGAGSTASLGGDYWSNSGSISVGPNATVTLSGFYSDGSVAKVTNNGGTVILDGRLNDSPSHVHSITASGGTLILDPSTPLYDGSGSNLGQGGTISGGNLFIDAGATLELRGDPLDGWITDDTVTFNAASGTLRLADPGDFAGSIASMSIGDKIDFAHLQLTGATLTGGLLTVTWSGGSDQYQVTASAQTGFAMADDGNHGTLLTLVAAATSWAKGISGSFDTATNWKPAAVPGGFNNVVINKPGSYTVTDSSDHVVNRLTIGNATAGGIKLDISHATLQVNGGVISNSGIIELDRPASLMIGANTKISGGGEIVLGGAYGGTDHIGSAAGLSSPVTLVNVDNTIHGSGSIGDSMMKLSNQGSIIAEGGNLELDGAVVNRGTLKAVAGGTLTINGTLNNNLGTLVADGGHLTVQGTLAAGGEADVVGYVGGVALSAADERPRG